MLLPVLQQSTKLRRLEHPDAATLDTLETSSLRQQLLPRHHRTDSDLANVMHRRQVGD
jgi:hypothetical protein